MDQPHPATFANASKTAQPPAMGGATAGGAVGQQSSAAKRAPNKSWRIYVPRAVQDRIGLLTKVRFLPLRRSDGVPGALYEDTPKARALIARLRSKHTVARDHLFLAPRSQVQALWAQTLAEPLSAFAREHLLRSQPKMSAFATLMPGQGFALGIMLIGSLVWGYHSAGSLFLLLNAVFAFFYLSIGFARLFAVFADPPRHRPLSKGMRDDDLPIYSVLVPVYDEPDVMAQLIASLCALDYPREKLEIFLLTEADDTATHAALGRLAVPDHIAVIRVPPSHPRTKPKALNFALPLTRGTFVTIYDAEDRPEPDQLRKAVVAFARDKKGGNGTLVCVQAALHITNGDTNFLTKHFALEYMALFDAFLPALSRLDLPIPLGGTSNHFRRDALMQVGGWDPFNVTEDADLGMRLARLGYTTQVIASTTYEEAPTRFKPWIKQRARWFKGWWQTWLVHMRNPVLLMHELGLSGFLTLNTIILGVLVSVLIHPFFLVATLLSLSGVLGPVFSDAQSTENALTAINLMNFCVGYLAAALLSTVGARRRSTRGVLPALLSIPLYWLLLSAAGFLALWELIRRPHHWNKTPHTHVGQDARQE